MREKKNNKLLYLWQWWRQEVTHSKQFWFFPGKLWKHYREWKCVDKSIKKFVYLICGFLLLRGFKSFWRAKSADKRAAGAKVGGGRASIPSTCTLYLYLWTCNTNTILVFIRLSTCQLRELCSNSFFYEYIQKGVWVMYF